MKFIILIPSKNCDKYIKNFINYYKSFILFLPFQLNIIIKEINKIFFRITVSVIEFNKHMNIYEFTR